MSTRWGRGGAPVVCFTSASVAYRCSSVCLRGGNCTSDELLKRTGALKRTKRRRRGSDPPVRWSCVQPAAEFLVITAAESSTGGETLFSSLFSCSYKLVLLLYLKCHLLHITASMRELLTKKQNIGQTSPRAGHFVLPKRENVCEN